MAILDSYLNTLSNPAEDNQFSRSGYHDPVWRQLFPMALGEQLTGRPEGRYRSQLPCALMASVTSRSGRSSIQ